VGLGQLFDDLGCTTGQSVRRNVADTAFECFTPSAGAANAVEVTLDFGTSGSNMATTVVVGQAWVAAPTRITCGLTGAAVGTRAEGDEDAIIDGLSILISNRVVATGFTVKAMPTQGNAYGQFLVHCVGV
jgi:hypothetical protein